MRTKRRKWRARRALSVWLACLMLASSVSLPVQAAEPQAASGERLEDAQVNPEGSESDATGESEGPEEETGAQESSETDITEQPSDAADSDGEDQQPGAEEEGQPENPDEEDDEDQSGNPGTENGGEQPDDPETPGENDQTDTEDGENQKDTEEMPEDSEDEEKNPVKAPLGEEDDDKIELTPFGITVEDKVYDGEAAAYTGTLMLKAPDGKEYVASLDYGFSVPPSYEGILADGSVYENTGSAPSQVGEYTMTFSRIYGGNSLYYKLKETVYRFKITPREVTVTADPVTVPVGGELPALSELTYHTDGLVKEDTLLTPPSLRYSPEEIPTDVEGSYEIVPSGADAGANYSITYVNGTLKVGAGEILYSGTTNKISWQIDHGGKLTIEGTGDYEGRPWLEYRDAIKYAEVEVTGITTTRDMFNGCSSLRSLDVSGLDTGNVTNMQSMFNGCSSLQSLDVSGFNTSNVTGEQYSGGGMAYMFSGCSSLKILEGLNNWDTSNVVTMERMFSGCSSLKILEGLDNWDVSNVIVMENMFGGCSSLEGLDLSGWDGRPGCQYNDGHISGYINYEDDILYSNVGQFLSGCDSLNCIRTPKKIASGTFGGIVLPPTAGDGLWYDDKGVAYKIVDGLSESITLTRTKVNAGKIKDISWEIDENGRLTISGTGEYLFDDHQKVEDSSLWKKEDMPPWCNRSDVLSAVVNVSGIRSTRMMFYGCSKLNSVELSGLDTSEVTDMSRMFSGCSSLETLNLNGLDTSDVTNMKGMFQNCGSLKTLNLNGLDTDDVTDMRDMFSGCSGLETLDLSGLDTGNVTDLRSMFSGCSSLKTLDLHGLDMGNVIYTADIYGGEDEMFDGCSGLETLDLSGLHLSRAMHDGVEINHLRNMLAKCSNLKTLNLSGADMGSITDMGYMFSDLRSLTTLDLNGLDTGNVTNMGSMFSGCSSLETLNLSGLDTGNVTYMGSMFSGCSSLETLNLSGLNTGNVTNMRNMFSGCSSLKTLNLSGLDMGNVTYMDNMFSGCSKLQALDLGSFDCSSMEGNFSLSACDSLSYIKTPRNLSELQLPYNSNWHDKNGKTYSSIWPLSDLKESIELYRDGGSGSGQGQYVYVSGISVESRPYDGNALAYTGTPEVTDASGNPVPGVTLTASYTGTLADGSEYPATAQAPSQAGNYTLSFAVSGTGEETYILLNSAYDFQISRLQVTITAPNRAVEVGGQLPDLSAITDYTVDGLLAGEQFLKAPAFKYRKANVSTQKPGSYVIIPYGAEAGMNYRIKYVKGQLTVGTMNSFDLSEAEIVFSDFELKRYGNHVVDPVVRYRDWTLQEGTDYELTLTGTAGGYNKDKRYWYVYQEGQYTIHITGKGFYHGEQTKTFLVGPKGGYGDVLPEDRPSYGGVPDGLWIAGISEYGYKYTGKAIKPEVRVYDHTKLLQEKTDYTISYAYNVNVNAMPADSIDGSGTPPVPTIIVKGKGNYSGTERKYFDIQPIDLSDWEVARVDVDDMTVAYNGRPQKPQPVLMWNGTKLNSNNYSISYYRYNEEESEDELLDSVKDPGIYSVEFRGKGNFAGSLRCALTVTDSLKIVEKLKVSKIPNQSYADGNEITPAVTVKDGATTLEQGVHYTLEYRSNYGVGTAYAVITGNPEAGYSGTKRVAFKITGTPIKKAAVTGLTASVYNGKPQMPELKLTIEKTVNGEQTVIDLKESKYNADYDYYEDGDYRLSWQKNENAGTATVVITGMCGYTGTVKKTFKINKYDIAANTAGQFNVVLEDSEMPYVKGGAKAKPVVTFAAGDGRELTLMEGKDYTLSYRRHTKLTGEGTDQLAEITIKGKGNFSGTYQNKLYYKIVHQDIGNLTLTAQDKVYQNKGNIYATKVTVTDVNGKALKAGMDYDKAITYTYANPTEVQDAAGSGTVNRAAGDTVEENDIIPVGTALKVRVTAKEGGSYFGSLEGEYRITQMSIASASVSVPQQTYTGQPVTLDKSDITVKVKGTPVADDQWEIVPDSYKNNVKKGTASVTIRGVDNYGGTKTVKFTIKAKGFLW